MYGKICKLPPIFNASYVIKEWELQNASSLTCVWKELQHKKMNEEEKNISEGGCYPSDCGDFPLSSEAEMRENLLLVEESTRYEFYIHELSRWQCTLHIFRCK